MWRSPTLLLVFTHDEYLLSKNLFSSWCFCSKKEVLSRLHFSPVPVFNLGNWISQVFYYWGSVSRNYVLSQVSFTSEGNGTFSVLQKRAVLYYLLVSDVIAHSVQIDQTYC